MHELATVEVSENLLLEVPHHFVDYMVLSQINADEGTATRKMSKQDVLASLGSERFLLERPQWDRAEEEVVE
jgi:hypothetical protein